VCTHAEWQAPSALESDSCLALAAAGLAAAAATAAAQGTKKRLVVAEPDYGSAAACIPFAGVASVVADLMTAWL
jgi:hypothetical protein